MLQSLLQPLLWPLLRPAISPAYGSSGGSPPAETFYLLTQAAEVLTTEAGDRLTWE